MVQQNVRRKRGGPLVRVGQKADCYGPSQHSSYSKLSREAKGIQSSRPRPTGRTGQLDTLHQQARCSLGRLLSMLWLSRMLTSFPPRISCIIPTVRDWTKALGESPIDRRIDLIPSSIPTISNDQVHPNLGCCELSWSGCSTHQRQHQLRE